MNPNTEKLLQTLFFVFCIIVVISSSVYLVYLNDISKTESDNHQDEDFIRTIRGLECHQLEQYILDMKYRWGEIIQYHSFKYSGLLEEYQINYNRSK